MVYSEDLAIPDKCSRKWANHDQTLLEKALYIGDFYSEQLLSRVVFLKPSEYSPWNLPLYTGHSSILKKNIPPEKFEKYIKCYDKYFKSEISRV